MMGALESEKMPKELRICGLVVEFIVAIDETRVRFPADALLNRPSACSIARISVGVLMHMLA